MPAKMGIKTHPPTVTVGKSDWQQPDLAVKERAARQERLDLITTLHNELKKKIKKEPEREVELKQMIGGRIAQIRTEVRSLSSKIVEKENASIEKKNLPKKKVN